MSTRRLQALQAQLAAGSPVAAETPAASAVAEGPPSVLYDKICFPEAPRWRDGRLYFVNIASEMGKTGGGGAGRVESVSLSGDHRVEVNLAPITGRNPSGLGWLPDGRLLIVSTGDFLLLARDPRTGEISKYADLSKHAVRRKGMLNDMTVAREGHAYVDLYTSGKLCKLICVPPGGGEGAEVATDMGSPNGLVLTPAGTQLIVGETAARRYTAFDRDPATGALSGRRVWADTPSVMPDGCCLDAEGCVWAASPSGKTSHFARIAPGGKILETISPPAGSGMACIACCLGGPDGRTLFLLETVHFPGKRAFDDPNRAHIRTVRVAVGAAADPSNPRYCAGYS